MAQKYQSPEHGWFQTGQYENLMSGHTPMTSQPYIVLVSSTYFATRCPQWIMLSWPWEKWSPWALGLPWYHRCVSAELQHVKGCHWVQYIPKKLRKPKRTSRSLWKDHKAAISKRTCKSVTFDINYFNAASGNQTWPAGTSPCRLKILTAINLHLV